jgi:hypothetical protein
MNGISARLPAKSANQKENHAFRKTCVARHKLLRANEPVQTGIIIKMMQSGHNNFTNLPRDDCDMIGDRHGK